MVTYFKECFNQALWFSGRKGFLSVDETGMDNQVLLHLVQSEPATAICILPLALRL